MENNQKTTEELKNEIIEELKNEIIIELIEEKKSSLMKKIVETGNMPAQKKDTWRTQATVLGLGIVLGVIGL